MANREIKVKLISDYDNNYGGCDFVKGSLKLGEIYTLEKHEVHSFHTKIYLKEFPDKVFNSVHFKYLKRGEK